MTVNRLDLEWEEKIKLHHEKKMEFGRWRNKNLKNERPALVKIEDEVIFDEEAWKFLGSFIRRLLEDDLTSYRMFLALGWHLEEIHVTWAHLEKKRTRLQTYTKSLEESESRHGYAVSSLMDTAYWSSE
ncbi:hypothetical protein Tco_0900646 [Tanacetum coccineum]